MKKFIVHFVVLASIILGSSLTSELLTAVKLPTKPTGISLVAENQPPNPLGSSRI